MNELNDEHTTRRADGTDDESSGAISKDRVIDGNGTYVSSVMRSALPDALGEMMELGIGDMWTSL